MEELIKSSIDRIRSNSGSTLVDKQLLEAIKAELGNMYARGHRACAILNNTTRAKEAEREAKAGYSGIYLNKSM